MEKSQEDRFTIPSLHSVPQALPEISLLSLTIISLEEPMQLKKTHPVEKGNVKNHQDQLW